MQLIEELERIAPGGPVILTIGVFDGVHLGHKHLIGQVVRRAKETGCLSAVITFHPHPLAVLQPGWELPALTTPQERQELLQRLKVDIIATLPFTKELAQLSAREFMGLVHQHLNVRELWVGPDFALGRGREGTIPRLQEIGQEMGFTVHTVPPFVLDGQVVSSTRIRSLLAQGDVAEAGRLLGRCVSFQGEVIRGARRGHTLGFPTANLAAEPGRALPADGIYVAHVAISPRSKTPGAADEETAAEPSTDNSGFLPAVVNVGTRPTFNNGQRLVEAYILDFNGDIYGQTLSVHFVQRLRGEMRFPSVEALVEQIRQDVSQARNILTDKSRCVIIEP